MKHEVILIPTEHCRTVWKQAKPHLKLAIDRSGGRWKSDYVLAALVLNEQSLWIIINESKLCVGAATTQIIEYPEKRMLAIHYLGGLGISDWYIFLSDALTKHGKELGCDAIECNARFGFW